MRNAKFEDQYRVYIDFGPEYQLSLFMLIVRSGELIFIDEEGLEFWFCDRSQKGLKEFLSNIEDGIGEYSKMWIENTKGERVDMTKVMSKGVRI